MKKESAIKASIGSIEADCVIKNVNYLNVFTKEFLQGNVAIKGDKFIGIGDSYIGISEIDGNGLTMVPGFIDGHIHLESSIISPNQFAKVVLPHGTTAVITDPHEITNILGTDGIDYMMQTTKNLPIDVFFVVPSCVPCSKFDENGAQLGYKDIKKYMKKKRVVGLAEMMNYVGTISGDKEILLKIKAAEDLNKIVDGHAPRLSGNELNAYVAAGIMSDHECTDYKEAIEKLRCGEWIMIREGTASHNLEALLPIINEQYFSRCMFVTDDKHPGDLINGGHIDYIVRKAIKEGANPIFAYMMSSFNVATYFGLRDYGAIASGYFADFILLNDINYVNINSVYKKGKKVFKTDLKDVQNKCEKKLLKRVYNTMNSSKISMEDIKIKNEKAKIIGLIKDELITTDEGYTSKINIEKDILKMCVIERHKNTGHIGVCFVKGYGLKKGAIATSIAHDSHNIIVIGCSDNDIVVAVNSIIDMQGGMNIVENNKVVEKLSLPIAGIMCDDEVENVKNKIDKLKNKAIENGVNKNIDPYMTMSFASLPVIPKLKLTTKGVVDVEKFCLIK